jgi:transposase InsO family protein
VGRKRVERLMREHRIVGVHRHRRGGCTVRDLAGQPSTDLVDRQFVADRPDALWVSDITQHRTDEGWVYCAVVLDTNSRRVVGWSIAARGGDVAKPLVWLGLNMGDRRRGRGLVCLEV